MTYSPYTLQGKAQLQAQAQLAGPRTAARKSRWLLGAGAVMAVAAITASAQVVSSPFAAKAKTQAWETVPAPQSSTNNSAPIYQAPTYQPPQYAGANSANGATATYRAPMAEAAPTIETAPQSYRQPLGTMAPATAAAPQRYTQPYTAAPTVAAAPAQSGFGQFGSYAPPRAPALSFQAPAPQDGTHYPGRPTTGEFAQYNPSSTPPLSAPNSGQWQAPVQQNQAGHYQPPSQNWGQNYQAQNRPPQTYSAPPASGPLRPVMAKASWTERLGLSNLATSISGFLKLGAGATDADTARDDGWRADFIGDGMVRAEVSAITLGGLEYGVGGELRGQYDPYRRGFGGLAGNCPPTQAGCSGRIVNGLPTGIRGHTSQFYASGLDNSEDITAQLEGAYIFLRSAYGDLTVGRDDGAAFLFSLGAPTLVAVNASNSPVDYTGLDSVKTVNDASGFAEKVTYVSPRLLGDQIGLGVQIGASYAPDAKACGVDYCVKSHGNDGSNTLAPELEDILEFGVSLDRTFQNGLSVEATATYATASETSGFAEMDDLQAFGAGLEFALKSWRLGGSYLQSNNALQDGDYTAYDIGISYKPARWGTSLSYGHATDDTINLTSDQATLGFVYDLTDKITLGTGVQYARRKVPAIISVNGADVLARDTESAASVFVEGGITF